MIKFFEFFTFYMVLDFTHTKLRHKRKINNKNKSNGYKEMHDVQMHDNKAFNA